MATRPIFIYSLLRSASTFVVQKFRAIETFSCYQEPFNESLAAQPDFHQPDIDQPDFHEFREARKHLRGLFRPSFAYDHYFAPQGQLPPAQQAWLTAIIEHAPARPVLQFCRSAGRVAALRSLFGGTHLHLWREPRAQWWSCQLAGHFDDISQRIYRSAQLPEALRAVRAMAGMGRTAGVGRPRPRHLLPRSSYVMFYGLWLDAWLRLCANSDLSISADRIALDPAENAECTRRLAALVECTIDLSDIRTLGPVLTPDEEPFYTQAEEAVHEVFARSGDAQPQALQAASAAAAHARSAHDGRRHDPAAEQNLRLAAMSLMRSLAGGGRPGGGRWPRRWYPRRLHDYVRWALKQLRGPRSPPTPRHGEPARDTAYRGPVQSPPDQPSSPIR